jgi:hypothetical protein
MVGQAHAFDDSWWLEDETTGENLGHTNQVFTSFAPWRPAPPTGSVSFSLIESRKNHALRLRKDSGETWNVTVDSAYLAGGAPLSYSVVATSPTTGAPLTAQVRYVPASVPMPAWNGGK